MFLMLSPSKKFEKQDKAQKEEPHGEIEEKEETKSMKDPSHKFSNQPLPLLLNHVTLFYENIQCIEGQINKGSVNECFRGIFKTFKW